MSRDTPRLTAEMARDCRELVHDGACEHSILDRWQLELAALQAIASGTHVVVPAADAGLLREAREFINNRSRQNWDGEGLDFVAHLDAALAAAEGERK